MLHRLIRITMLAWLTAWFAGVVPAHRIGMIKVPGSAVRSQYSGLESQPAVRAAGHCCPKGDERAPSMPSRSSCAVCQMVAKLDAARPIVITVPPIGLAEVLPLPDPDRPSCLQVICRHGGRDPPSLFA